MAVTELDADPVMIRTSCRNYTPEPVSGDDVERLLRAGMAAPSAHNQQPWEFYVVTDPARREALAHYTPWSSPAGRAPLVLVVCGRTAGIKDPPSAVCDLGACTENILIEAATLHLGAVWLSCAPYPERMAAVSQIVGIPDGLSPYAVLAVGHPAEERRHRERYDPARVHYL